MAGSRKSGTANPTGVETTVGIVILSFLFAAGTLIWRQQYRFDPNLYRANAAESTTAAPASHGADGDLLGNLVPQGYAAFGPAETFDRNTLSDKIDGKAELYLESGVVGMVCRRFADSKTPSAWFEVFVYDMGNPLNAFAVFSNQRRADAGESEVAPFAYNAGGSLFLVHGRHYLEILPSETGGGIVAAVEQSARKFIASTPAQKENGPSPLELLPPEGLIRGSVTLLLKDAYGFDKLDNVVSGDYLVDGTTTTAFLSRRESATSASELAGAYHTLLVRDMGAEKVTLTTSTVPGLLVANVLGDYELVFATGDRLAGIHAGKDLAAAEKLARRLHRAAGGGKP